MVIFNKVKYVFLITIDALRHDYLNFSDSNHIITPNINKLAKKSLVFKRCYSVAPYTKASFFSIMTSLYPFSTGQYLSVRNQITLPEHLNKLGSGFFTAGFPNIPMLSKKYGYNKGFDYFLDLTTPSITGIKALPLHFSELFRRSRNLRYISFLISLFTGYTPYILGKDLVKKIIKIFEHNREHSNKKIFVWAHFMDVHHPYIHLENNLSLKKKLYAVIKNARLNNMFYSKIENSSVSISEEDLCDLKKMYAIEISYIDESIGILINYLKAKDLWNETLFIITADHGEEFLEHGSIGHIGSDYVTHMYDELLRVPLIISHPNLRGKVFPHLVSLIDLTTIILDILNLDNSPFPLGYSINSLIKLKGRDYVISEASAYNRNRHIYSPPVEEEKKTYSIVTREGYKLILSEISGEMLFDLNKSPTESINIDDKNKKILKKLRAFLYNHTNKQEWKKGNHITLDESARAQLGEGI